MILSLFRIIEGYVRFDWKAFCLHKDLEDGRRSTLSEVLIDEGVLNIEEKIENKKKKRGVTFKSKFNILSISGKRGVSYLA